MPDRRRPWMPRVRHSVFAKLVAIMLAMAVSLLALVAVFFTLYVSPALHASIDRVIEQYARAIAASRPDYETAKRLSAGMDVQIRYEGPGGAWSTSRRLPSIAEFEGRQKSPYSWRRYYVVPVGDGGKYLFAWTFAESTRTVHRVLLMVLLLLIASIVFVAHTVLKHLLRPVRELAEGVDRLSDGHLDTTVPRRSNDEFGALADAFNEMVGRVRGMIRSRDQLLLDVSHELRSPVTRLKVALELVGDPDMKTRMAADLAEIEIMIGELIELERFRNGHGIKPARANLVTLLDEVVRNFQDRRPGVHLTLPAAELPVDIDADRMRVVVRNLIENAIKYSGPDRQPVEVAATPDGDRIAIRVTDDGPGIPETDIPNLFDPFFRVDRSRSKKTGGYGLGLSIAKRIVEAHGGTLAVRNNVPRGATFTVTLPRPA